MLDESIKCPTCEIEFFVEYIAKMHFTVYTITTRRFSRDGAAEAGGMSLMGWKRLRFVEKRRIGLWDPRAGHRVWRATAAVGVVKILLRIVYVLSLLLILFHYNYIYNYIPSCGAMLWPRKMGISPGNTVKQKAVWVAGPTTSCLLCHLGQPSFSSVYNGKLDFSLSFYFFLLSSLNWGSLKQHASTIIN